MKQTTFDSLAYTAKNMQMRRERFLSEMEQVVPWQALWALVAEHHPKRGKAERLPISFEVVRRIHFLQQRHALSDPATEGDLHEIESVWRPAGFDFDVHPFPDETTIQKFRRLLELHALAPKFLETVNTHLAARSIQMRARTLVHASSIHAPSSTKYRIGTRNPEMHQTKTSIRGFSA